jgi:hypothetical protein
MRLRSVVAALVAIAAVSCKDSTSDDSGRLTVKLTDAPFPFSEVSRVDVHVVRIDARAEAADSAAAGNAAQTSGWTTIASPDATINLLSLTGGTTTNLGTGTLSNGTYNGFRMIIDPARSSVTLKNGTNPSVQWPSAAQTGIKINLDAPIAVNGDSGAMVLDFDVGKSFIMRGNSISQNGLLFKPVIRATATELTRTVSGTVRSGSATGPLVVGASVELLTAGSLLGDTDPTHVVATTTTDASGAYRFGFVLPGTYVLRVTPPAGSGFSPTLFAGGITVVAGTDVSGTVVVVMP